MSIVEVLEEAFWSEAKIYRYTVYKIKGFVTREIKTIYLCGFLHPE